MARAAGKAREARKFLFLPAHQPNPFGLGWLGLANAGVKIVVGGETNNQKSRFNCAFGILSALNHFFRFFGSFGNNLNSLAFDECVFVGHFVPFVWCNISLPYVRTQVNRGGAFFSQRKGERSEQGEGEARANFYFYRAEIGLALPDWVGLANG